MGAEGCGSEKTARRDARRYAPVPFAGGARLELPEPGGGRLQLPRASLHLAGGAPRCHEFSSASHAARHARRARPEASASRGKERSSSRGRTRRSVAAAEGKPKYNLLVFFLWCHRRETIFPIHSLFGFFYFRKCSPVIDQCVDRLIDLMVQSHVGRKDKSSSCALLTQIIGAYFCGSSEAPRPLGERCVR